MQAKQLQRIARCILIKNEFRVWFSKLNSIEEKLYDAIEKTLSFIRFSENRCESLFSIRSFFLFWKLKDVFDLLLDSSLIDKTLLIRSRKFVATFDEFYQCALTIRWAKTFNGQKQKNNVNSMECASYSFRKTKMLIKAFSIRRIFAAHEKRQRKKNEQTLNDYNNSIPVSVMTKRYSGKLMKLYMRELWSVEWYQPATVCMIEKSVLGKGEKIIRLSEHHFIHNSHHFCHNLWCVRVFLPLYS